MKYMSKNFDQKIFWPKSSQKLQNMWDNDRQKKIKNLTEIFCHLHNQYMWPYTPQNCIKTLYKCQIYIGWEYNSTLACLSDSDSEFWDELEERSCHGVTVSLEASWANHGHWTLSLASHPIFLQIWRRNSTKSMAMLLYKGTSICI